MFDVTSRKLAWICSIFLALSAYFYFTIKIIYGKRWFLSMFLLLYLAKILTFLRDLLLPTGVLLLRFCFSSIFLTLSAYFHLRTGGRWCLVSATLLLNLATNLWGMFFICLIFIASFVYFYFSTEDFLRFYFYLMLKLYFLNLLLCFILAFIRWK